MDIITKPRQRTSYVVRKGTRPVYRGDSSTEAISAARAHGEAATITFRSREAARRYLRRAS